MATFQSGGVDSNWSTPGNWSTGIIPTSAVAAVFDATSPSCTVDIAGVCASLNFTGYTNTITMTNGITSSGSVTLVLAMTILGTGNLAINGTSTITSNGKSWPNSLTLSGGITHTIADTLTIVGNLSTTGAGNVAISNGVNNLYVGGNLTIGAGTGISGVTGALIMNGTGTFSAPGSNSISINFTIATAGTVTLSGNFILSNRTFTYTSGSVITTGSSLLCRGASTILNCSGMNGTGGASKFNNISFDTTTTSVLLSDIYCSNTLTLGNTTLLPVINGVGFNVNAGGNVTVGITTGTVTGTATIVMTGTSATLSTSAITTGYIGVNLKFNTTGTITINSTLPYRTGTITNISSGTVTAPTLLDIQASAGLSAAGITWNNITLASGITLTQGSNNALSGTLTTAGTTTINGAYTLSGSKWILGTTTLAGSSTVVFTGNAFASDTISGTDLTVNSTGTLSFLGTLIWSVPTFTNTAGTITNTGGKLLITSNKTFNGATTWGSWDVSGSPTITMNALQSFSGTLNIGTNITFSGTAGFTADTLKSTIPGTTITLLPSVTYTVLSNFTSSGLAGVPVLYVSSSSPTRSILTVNLAAITSLFYTNATDIDSSLGKNIITTNGVLSNTLNWTVGAPNGVAYSFVN